jgi:hypothetical protein
MLARSQKALLTGVAVAVVAWPVIAQEVSTSTSRH